MFNVTSHSPIITPPLNSTPQYGQNLKIDIIISLIFGAYVVTSITRLQEPQVDIIAE